MIPMLAGLLGSLLGGGAASIGAKAGVGGLLSNLMNQQNGGGAVAPGNPVDMGGGIESRDLSEPSFLEEGPQISNWQAIQKYLQGDPEEMPENVSPPILEAKDMGQAQSLEGLMKAIRKERPAGGSAAKRQALSQHPYLAQLLGG